MIKQEIKFQSIKVKFPKNLYLGTMWIVGSNNKLLIYPMHELQSSAKATLTAARKVYDQLINEGYKVLDHIIFTKLTFLQNLPLKKEYWENPQVNFHEVHRMVQFSKLFDNYSAYKLLITPVDAKTNKFNAAVPFLISADTKDVESFMYSSDWFVDPLADISAFYRLDRPLSLNLLTGKVFEKDNEKKRGRKLIN